MNLGTVSLGIRRREEKRENRSSRTNTEQNVNYSKYAQNALKITGETSKNRVASSETSKPTFLYVAYVVHFIILGT